MAIRLWRPKDPASRLLASVRRIHDSGNVATSEHERRSDRRLHLEDSFSIVFFFRKKLIHLIQTSIITGWRLGCGYQRDAESPGAGDRGVVPAPGVAHGDPRVPPGDERPAARGGGGNLEEPPTRSDRVTRKPQFISPQTVLEVFYHSTNTVCKDFNNLSHCMCVLIIWFIFYQHGACRRKIFEISIKNNIIIGFFFRTVRKAHVQHCFKTLCT